MITLLGIVIILILVPALVFGYLSESISTFIGILVVGWAFVFTPIAWIGQSFANERTITCTVTDKDRGKDNGSYRIYTEDCGVFANKDMWLRGKTDSADIQGQTKIGSTQTFTVVGWRFGPLSWFPNVLRVDSPATVG